MVYSEVLSILPSQDGVQWLSLIYSVAHSGCDGFFAVS
jgi:hypothetical protein